MRDNLKPLNKLPTIAELVAEGDRLLEEEERLKSPPPPPEPIKLVKGKNPYSLAKDIIIRKLPAWKRREIEEMEKTGNINNRTYDDFIRQVHDLGDTMN